MKILYIINHVAFFVSHRLPIALEAQKNGHKVALLTGKGASPEMESAALKKLKEAKIKHFLVDFKSDGINPFSEFFSLVKVILEIKKYAPDIIHSASPKGNLYAGLSAKFLKIKLLIISISGQGKCLVSLPRVYLK
jgi:UDP-N-acetylglucosamine:LPS N-acetylglucosamine transferase